MYKTIRTAVAAVAAGQIRIQLVRALSACGIELLHMAADAADARRAIADLRPDLFIADRELPGLDGCTLMQQLLSGHTIPVRPAAILLFYPEFPSACDARLVSLGCALVHKPVQPASFAAAIQALCSDAPVFPERELRHADMLLSSLGVPLHTGRSCLKTAILLCAADERFLKNFSGGLYPAVGAIHGLNPLQAERAMRHAIDRAWQSNQFENQYRIFADTVDAGRGQPTPREMISRLADILRLEG